MILVSFLQFFSYHQNLNPASSNRISDLISLIIDLHTPGHFQAAYDKMVRYFMDNRFRFQIPFPNHRLIFWGHYTRRVAVDNAEGYFNLRVQRVRDLDAKPGQQQTFGLLFNLNVPYRQQLLPLMVELIRTAQFGQKSSVARLELPGDLIGLTPDSNICRSILNSYQKTWKLKAATIGESLKNSSWLKISNACLNIFKEQFLQNTGQPQIYFEPPTNSATP